MNIARMTGLIGILALASCMAVGCCDAEKTRITELSGQNADLTTQNQSLKDDLAAATVRNNELENQLAAKGPTQPMGPGKITETNTGATATGWEKGLTGDRLTVGTDVLFSPGQAKLTGAGQNALDKVASTLKSTYAGKTVRIYGYTDNDPIVKTKNLWMDNLDLSANRAMAVTRYLWGKGISRDRIETIAMGDTHSVASNAAKAGKAKNRRVEIIVIKSK